MHHTPTTGSRAAGNFYSTREIMSLCILTTGAPRRIGFVLTRFYGTDGVTLEVRKWAQILNNMDHQCF